jgi:amylosucrase
MCGTTASLCGIEAAEYEKNEFKQKEAIKLDIMLHAFLLTQTGMPVLYSGDEIGQLNDYTYHDDPVKCEDSRYIHRGNFNWDEAALRNDETTRQGKLFQTIKKLEDIRKAYQLFECDADAWTLETYNDKILGIGRYYEGEKLLALFNFGEEDETAWINEDEDYIDLVTGKPRAAKAVGVPAHDFAWLYYNFNPKPEVKVEEVKAEESAAPAEEAKAEEPAAPAEEVKAEEPAAPKKTTRKRTTKKAAGAPAEEAPKKTTRKRTAKKAAAADAPAAEEAPKKTTRKRTTKKAAKAEE